MNEVLGREKFNRYVTSEETELTKLATSARSLVVAVGTLSIGLGVVDLMEWMGWPWFQRGFAVGNWDFGDVRSPLHQFSKASYSS
ncbi:hypothetical protein QT970_18195 [Microcoleus sp. herbarium8]|uniref:hypothetical protein n=1 Tax=Microcoleus sp. herbarium8 TaxID=3055436 RepID=UPI002FD2F33D